MARIQSARTSWIIATTVFGIAFAFSLAFAIIFGLQITAAKLDKQKAEDELAKVAGVEDRHGADFAQLLQQGAASRSSVYRQLTGNLESLIEKVSGVKQQSLDALMTDMNIAGLKNDERLLPAFKTLLVQHQEDASLTDQLKTKLTDEAARAQNEIKRSAELEANYNTAKDNFKKQIDALTEAQTQFQSKVTADVANLQGNFTKELATANQRAASLSTERDQSTQDLVVAKHRLEDLEKLLGKRSNGAVDPSLMPDGHVSSVFADSKIIYIDLGRKDRLPLGLTFEVFDPSQGVSKDADGLLRGKATIEVTNVLDNTSACRVLRREPGKDLMPGDIIANAVYDPAMKFKFLVYGDFDIDGTGRSSMSDRRRIEAMITQWGGTLVSTPEGQAPAVGYDVDFLVLGAQPPQPQAPKDPTDLAQINEANAQKQRYEEFASLLKEAHDLSIPVLNQNRFLVMVGYYKR